VVAVPTKSICGSEAAVQARWAASVVRQTSNTRLVERNTLTCRQCHGRRSRKVLSFSTEPMFKGDCHDEAIFDREGLKVLS
jgi:hypothetical protein